MTTTTAAPIAVPDTFHGDQYLSLTALFSIAGGRPVADDSGAPKSMLYGSHQRSVLTSASLRRAERTHSRHLANNGHGPLADAARGIRTRELAIMVANQLHDLGWDSEDASVDAMSIARSALSGMGLKFGAERTANLTKVLLFIPESAPNAIATVLLAQRTDVEQWHQQAQEGRDHNTAQDEKRAKVSKAKRAAIRTGEPAEISEDLEPGEAVKVAPLPKALRDALTRALDPGSAIDIALYGRFLAEIQGTPNIDGALQHAPAFTVTAAAESVDFYSAADDAKLARKANPPRRDAMAYLDHGDNGSGITGYQTLISGTFFRHAALDRWLLRRNILASGLVPEQVEALAQAAEEDFVTGFIDAMPQAKRNTTAVPGTLPKMVLAFTGKRPFNYAGIFERVIVETDKEAASVTAARRLLAQHELVTRKRADIQPGRVLTYDLDVQELLDDLRAAGRLVPAEAATVAELLER